MEETAVSSTENKSEFLLTDYLVSMEEKEVPLVGNLVHRLRNVFGKHWARLPRKYLVLCMKILIFS